MPVIRTEDPAEGDSARRPAPSGIGDPVLDERALPLPSGDEIGEMAVPRQREFPQPLYVGLPDGHAGLLSFRRRQVPVPLRSFVRRRAARYQPWRAGALLSLGRAAQGTRSPAGENWASAVPAPIPRRPRRINILAANAGYSQIWLLNAYMGQV